MQETETSIHCLGQEDPLEEGMATHSSIHMATQCSCLENPTDRGACWATVHRATKSQTQLKRLSMHSQGTNVCGAGGQVGGLFPRS